MMQGGAAETATGADFEDMYRRELRTMTALGAALAGSRETGADLAHEAMLRAFRAWPAVGQLDRPGAWVRRVVINLATDAHRRRQREQRAIGRLRAPAHVDADRPVGAPFWAAVRALPDRQRAAVALRYLDDLSVDEIAFIMQVSAGSIKKTLFIARRTLANTLGTEEVHDDDDR